MTDEGTPAACPRLLDGGSGPRACPWVACRSHLRELPSRGPISTRVRLQVLCDDTCARDVRDRATASGVQPTYREIAVLLGTTPQAVERDARNALAKVRLAVQRFEQRGERMRRRALVSIREKLKR